MSQKAPSEQNMYCWLANILLAEWACSTVVELCSECVPYVVKSNWHIWISVDQCVDWLANRQMPWVIQSCIFQDDGLWHRTAWCIIACIIDWLVEFYLCWRDHKVCKLIHCWLAAVWLAGRDCDAANLGYQALAADVLPGHSCRSALWGQAWQQGNHHKHARSGKSAAQA